jgi:splicing factor 45
VEERKAHAADLVAQIKARLAAKSANSSIASATVNVTPHPSAAALAQAPVPPAWQYSQPPQIPPARAPQAQILPMPPQVSQGVYSAPFQPMVSNVPPPPPPSEPEAVPSGFGGRATADKFAEKMLQKYGWEKGKGLGAHNDGITTAIVAKAEKRKKLADADGGGFATPKNMGKIVGGKKRKMASEDGHGDEQEQPAKLSEVIKLEGMLDGLDIDQEISENNILQEIGDEMASSGQVERLFIWREEQGGRNEVFVKYTSPLSALRALKSCDGMEFADNKVAAKFWDVEKFERGEYA